MTFRIASHALLARLVSFDTVSSASNLPLIDWVAGYLEGHGITSHVTHSADRSKANLFATIGSQDQGGVCLHGHTDVVPVAGQPWDSDPFVMSERGGRFYGRGTSDMKAWLACALAALPAFQSRPLKTPIHLALSYDEEVGCLGAPGMISTFGHAVPRPLVAIVGEPSLMAPITAHKGVLAMETVITGRDAHSSMPQLGVSAVTAAAEMVAELEALAREWRLMEGPPGMDPPGPTINVGMLRGGVALNLIAREAKLVWEIRFRRQDACHQLLDDATARVTARLRRCFGAQYEVLGIKTRQFAEIPAFDAGPGGLAEQLVLQLGASGPAVAVPYGAEAGQYADAGISTVICGPGSIAQAHQPNEFIETRQVAACDAFLARLAHWAAEVRLEAASPSGAGPSQTRDEPSPQPSPALRERQQDPSGRTSTQPSCLAPSPSGSVGAPDTAMAA